MSQSLREFARYMTDRANAMPTESSEVAVKVARAIVRDLVTVTPVDSSKALSNWQVALGSKAGGRLEPYFYGDRGSTQETSAAAALAAAELVFKQKKPGQSIIITNNLPYIRRLNDGYSKQAPAGFVERAELIGRKMAKA